MRRSRAWTAVLVMVLAVLFVLVSSTVVVSLLRNQIPASVRIITQLTIIASMVIVADQVLRAFVYDIALQLSVFIGLIITNCIIMGRAEAFAMQNPVKLSLLDGVGNGLGSLLDKGATPGLSIFFDVQVLTPILGLAVLSLLPVLYKMVKARRGGRS